jgi:hypothetical protein
MRNEYYKEQSKNIYNSTAGTNVKWVKDAWILRKRHWETGSNRVNVYTVFAGQYNIIGREKQMSGVFELSMIFKNKDRIDWNIYIYAKLSRVEHRCRQCNTYHWGGQMLDFVRKDGEKSLLENIAQNTTKLRPHHTQDHTQYRRPTVKEHDHYWDSQQGITNWNILLILTTQF